MLQDSSPRWEGSFEVDFRLLRWHGAADGAEKIDLLIPVGCKALGNTALLKLSGALSLQAMARHDR